MPIVDQLPSPQLESEAKRTSVKVTKQTVVPIVEGTSVAPRQRPKGGQPLPVGGVLPIPLGSSPVPAAAGSSRRHTAPLPLPSLSQSPVSVNGAPAAASESVTPAATTTPPNSASSASNLHQPPVQTLPPSNTVTAVHQHTPQLSFTSQSVPSQAFFPSPVSAAVSFDPRTASNPSHSSVAPVSVQDQPANVSSATVKSTDNSRESLEALFPASGKLQIT